MFPDVLAQKGDYNKGKDKIGVSVIFQRMKGVNRALNQMF